MINALRADLFDDAVTIAITEVDAPHQGVRQRARERTVILFGAEIAVNGFHSAFEHVGWLFVKNVDRATNSVTTVQCALRTTQYFDTLDIPEGCSRSGQQVF